MSRVQTASGAPTPGREGQTFAGDSILARYASFVKLPHTLFALPFAGVGAILASYHYPAGVSVATLLWILVAFTAARFVAMGFNRIVDRELDALNPRTRLRELPSGRLTLGQAWVAVIVAAALFIFAAWRLNPLCAALAPVALAWVCFYSYTKRFTSLSHAVLGYSLGIAPVGAYLAIAGTWSEPWYALVILASGVMCWVAGFDVIYAIQDLDFDRQQGLRSLPARLGLSGALRAARIFHFLAVALFLSLRWVPGFPGGWLYLAGVAVMAALLTYEHWIVRAQAPGKLDLVRIDRAFFRVNVGVSTTFFAFVLLDRLLLQ
ncbi:MAG TPA: UbiA-like polyprenyltransferase [Longimicrobiales bacterium]|nr:UbiA-like polyprenyltransferase [Longimicrobiales bacterium]